MVDETHRALLQAPWIDGARCDHARGTSAEPEEDWAKLNVRPLPIADSVRSIICFDRCQSHPARSRRLRCRWADYRRPLSREGSCGRSSISMRTSSVTASTQEKGAPARCVAGALGRKEWSRFRYWQGTDRFVNSIELWNRATAAGLLDRCGQLMKPYRDAKSGTRQSDARLCVDFLLRWERRSVPFMPRIGNEAASSFTARRMGDVDEPTAGDPGSGNVKINGRIRGLKYFEIEHSSTSAS